MKLKVWDPVVRIFHWGLAGSFLLAWITADKWDTPHHWAGYIAATLVIVRLFWGIAGGHYARFSQFVRGPATTIGYLRDIAANREKRYIGHNPAGAAMVIALILGMFSCALTGWLTTTDVFWGVKWVKEVHEVLANTMLVLICLHLAGVLLASIRHNENLVRAMVTGKKRMPGSGDIA